MAWLARAQAAWHQVIPPGADGRIWWLTALATFGASSIAPIFANYADQEGLSLGSISAINATFFGVNFLALYVAGRASDRLGRRPLLATGLLGVALCSFGFVVWHGLSAFFTLRALEGLAAACFMPAALAYVADRAPPALRGMRLAQLAMAENMGMFLGPFLGGLVAQSLGFPALFGILGALSLVGGLLVATLPSEKPNLPAPRLSSPSGTGRLMESSLPGAPSGLAESEAQPKSPSGWVGVRWALLAGLGLRTTAAGFALGLYFTVWPIFLADMGGSLTDVGNSWAIAALPSIVLAYWAGKGITRFGPAPWALGGAALSALVVGGYGLTGNVPLLLGLCALEGVGFAFAYPAINALTVQAATEGTRGRVIGLVTASRTLGMVLGTLITPALYAVSALHAFGLAGAAWAAGGLALALGLLVDRRKGHSGAESAPAAGAKA